MLMKLVDNKKSTGSAMLLMLILVVWAISSVYTNLSALPAGQRDLTDRVVAIELNDVDVCAQLKSINSSLARIETGVSETRREVSDLKTSLIHRRK